MKFTQEDGVSIITMTDPLTGGVAAELSELFSYIGGQDPHKIILNIKLVPYINSTGLDLLFQEYSPLFYKKFNLEIEQASEDNFAILKLANFHLIAKISPILKKL